MSYSTKFSHLAAAIVLISISGCAQDLERLSNDLRALNQGTSRSVQATPGLSLAQSTEAAQAQPTQLIIPTEKSVKAAIDSALPVIKEVISLNRCMKNEDSLRMLNFYAVPGKNFQLHWYYPNSRNYLKYHDFNKCISARTMDQWSMPALNALQFRAVYFAEDSGETVNFEYGFKRMEDGSWKLNSIRPDAR